MGNIPPPYCLSYVVRFDNLPNYSKIMKRLSSVSAIATKSFNTIPNTFKLKV